MTFAHRHRALEALALAGILLWAAGLRLGWPGVNLFDFDQTQVSLLALRMGQAGKLAFLGMPSSSALPNFPAAVWIFALPFAFSPDPLVASLFVGALNTLAVLGLWQLARGAWGGWAGLSAALLLAVSPFAVVYARDIWSQDLLPPLAVSWALAGVIGFGEDRAWALALHVFLAGFAFQVHYAGATLILPTLWMLLRYRPGRRWLAVGLGGLAAIVCAGPAMYALWCCQPEAVDALRELSREPAQVDATAAVQTFRLALGLGWENVLIGPAWKWPPALAAMLAVAMWVVGLLIALGCIAWLRDAPGALRSGPRDWRGALGSLLPAWALSSVILFTRHVFSALPHYHLAALPAIFLLAGGAATLIRRWEWGLAITALVLVISLPRSAALAQHYQVLGQQRTPGGMGTPLKWPRAAAQALKDGGRVVALSHGDDLEFIGDAAAAEVLWWGYPHQVVDGRSALLIPPRAGVHLFSTYPDLPAWNEALSSGITGTAQTFPRRKGDPPYLALTLHTSSPSGFLPLAPLTLANGAQLQGWRVRPVDGRWRVTTLWRIVGQGDGKDYHQFHHLYAGPAAQLAAIQDIDVSSRAWQVGDTLLAWADIAPPAGPGPFLVDVGMYNSFDDLRSPVTDRPGVDPLAPIRLGPFERPAPPNP